MRFRDMQHNFVSRTQDLSRQTTREILAARGNLVRDMNIVNIEMEFEKYVENWIVAETTYVYPAEKIIAAAGKMRIPR